MSEEFLRDIASTVEELEQKRKERSSVKSSGQKLSLSREELNLSKEDRSIYSEEGVLEKRRMEIIKAIRDLLAELEQINNKIRELRTRELLMMENSGVVIDIDQG